MQNRFWPFVYLGVFTGGVAAVLSSLNTAVWLIFAAILSIIIIFAFLREAKRDAVEPDEIVLPEDTKLQMPTGFGRAILEQMPLPLLVVSAAGRVTYANLSAIELLPNLQIGEHFTGIFSAPSFVDAMNATLTTGEPQKVGFTNGNTSERYYEARMGRLPAGSEFGSGMQVIAEIEDRTKERLGDKMRRDFIANASHELRTPLASILGYIETLQGHAKDDPKARVEFLKIMDKQATRMQGLVEDLMSLSKIEMNEHIRPQNRCALHELGNEAVSGLLPLSKKYNVTLENSLTNPGPIVLADKDQINQILVNLIDNAMKYGRDGEVVRIYEATPDIEYAGMTGITIEDRGDGIAPKHLSRLTERFYRVNAAQSRTKGGTGLGLAIVKHILTRHAGSLEIESTLGEGSKFTIWLPMI